MPFYDEKSALHEFMVVDNVTIKIMRTWRGGKCCNLDILPTETVCPLCGNDVEAETVYFPIIGDTPVLIYYPDSESTQDLAIQLLTESKVNPKSDGARPFSRCTADPTPPGEDDDDSSSRYDEILKQATTLDWGQKLLSFVKEKGKPDSDPKENRPRKIIPRRR